MRGKLFVVSGPSGVGKNTLLNAVVARSVHVRYSISATSRAMRPGEVDGKSYYFVTREQFEKLIADDALLEYAEYVGNYYGTPLQPIREAIEAGTDIVMDVDVVGALKIKKRLPGAVLERARWEYTQAHQYDYILLNEDVEQTAGELMAIMTAEKCKTMERIHLIKEEL